MAWQAATLSREQGFAHLLTVIVALRGWALVERGHRQEGIALLQESVAAWQTTGAELLRPYYLALLAEGYAKGGQIEEGLATLAAAFAVMERTGERWWEAELYRLKGELMLQQEARGWRLEIGPSSPQASSLKPLVSRVAEQEAEGYFLKAIEIARRQSAKMLELRAVMSLSRLWQRRGRKAEARQTLVEIYQWFTEGFDSVDHKQARALLKELL